MDTPTAAGTTPVLAQARAIAPTLRDAASRNEASRQLDEVTVSTLAEAGVFRMVMSERLGGPQLDPLAQLEVIEEISDSGWVGGLVFDDRF